MLCDYYNLRHDMICAWYGLLCLKTYKCYDMVYVDRNDMIDMQNNELA